MTMTWGYVWVVLSGLLLVLWFGWLLSRTLRRPATVTGAASAGPSPSTRTVRYERDERRCETDAKGPSPAPPPAPPPVEPAERRDHGEPFEHLGTASVPPSAPGATSTADDFAAALAAARSPSPERSVIVFAEKGAAPPSRAVGDDTSMGLRVRAERAEARVRNLQLRNRRLEQRLAANATDLTKWRAIAARLVTVEKRLAAREAELRRRNTREARAPVRFEPVPVRDDLKLIRGIGPVMERRLNALGVTAFTQLAAFTAEDVRRVSMAIDTFPRRIEQDDWVGQAARFVRDRASVSG